MTARPRIKACYAPVDPGAEFWKTVPAYQFALSHDVGGFPAEEAVVQFGWNEQGLYVFAKLADSSLVCTNRQNEQLHFETGDVFELFVKPRNDDYYWEMYATPMGNKSTLFFPRERKGMTVQQHLTDHDFRDLEVVSRITRSGWSTQLFVPADQLTALGAEWCSEAEWSLLCGRYNYHDETLTRPELSMVPALSKTNYHLTNEYAVLNFEPVSKKGTALAQSAAP